MLLFDTISKHPNPLQSAVTPVSANNWENVSSPARSKYQVTPSPCLFNQPKAFTQFCCLRSKHFSNRSFGYSLTHVHLPLASLSCQSLTSGCVPDYFKTAGVFPVLKKTSSTLLNNFGPISKLPVSCQLVEIVGSASLVLVSNGFLYTFQIPQNSY